MDELTKYHAQKAELVSMGEHWHQKLWYGDGDWAGDRFLNIYHHPLTDKIIVKYEVPNKKPETVLTISVAEFDIHKLCAALHKADNRTSSVKDKMDAADKTNALLDHRGKVLKQERDDEFIEKAQWAVRKDTGQHVAPMTVPVLR